MSFNFHYHYTTKDYCKTKQSNAKAQGTSVHARSLYLQGLLLTKADKWPGWISQESIKHHKELGQKQKQGTVN